MTINEKEQIMIEGIPIKCFSREEVDLIFSDPKIIDIIKMVKEYMVKKSK